MKVLVTGGSGFLGSRLKKFQSNWIYLSSKECNLEDQKSFDQTLKILKPDAVVHLAAKVGGIKDNSLHQADYFYKNTIINTNVVNSCLTNNVPRLLASLSTCAFPNKVEFYPFTENNLFDGPPAETNFSYGYSKRNLYVHCNSIRKQYGLNYSCFSPSNIYGIGDKFNSPNSSHFVASLIAKIANSKDGDNLEFWGSGIPMRQQLYIDDLCKIIPKLLENHNTEEPLIVAPDENLSIKEMIEIAIKVSNKNINYYFNNELDGQLRKDGSNKMLLNKIKFNFTTFKDGFRKTYNHYNSGVEE